MDVTIDNFGEIRELIERKLLPQARYFSFDLEFTGLRYQKFQRDHINYLPFEKYKKLKYVAETYQILQFGLSIVTFQKELKVYPFNFYLFPRNPAFYEKNLTMQLGCVKFNTSNGMDWNKWIREGINYVKISQMPAIDTFHKSKSYKDILENIPSDVEDYAREFLRKIEEVSQAKQGKEHTFILPRNAVQSTFSLLFYKYIQEKKLTLALTENEDRLIIKKIPQEERDKIFQKHKESIYGFALLFQHIWAAKKTFVGHNCNLDLLYIYHNFVAPLPESYFQFKQSLRQSGNLFLDTKFMAIKNPKLIGEGSRLQDLVANFRQKQNLKEVQLTKLALDGPFSRYSLDKAALHEAGYDSYLTAWVYQQIMKFDSEVHEKCKNKLNLLNSFFYIDLSKDEDQINPHYADNILRVNISLQQTEDIRVRRAEEMKTIKRALEQYKESYNLYEGYRQLFIEIKENDQNINKSRENRKKIISKVFEMMKKKQIKEVNTFSAYLAWQKERALREFKREESKSRGFDKRSKRDDDSESNQSRKWKKMES